MPNIVEHQAALQRIATLNDDTREVFSPGYTESLDYVVQTLRDAGYNPKVTPFNYPFWEETPAAGAEHGLADAARPTGPARRRTPISRRSDFITMANSPHGRADERAGVPGRRDRRPAHRRLGAAAARPPTTPASPARSRSSSAARARSSTKWQFAQAAGATGVIIYNEGNTPARQNPIFVDNQPTPKATIAAVISSYTLGNELLQAYKAGKNPTVDFKVYGMFSRPLPATR